MSRSLLAAVAAIAVAFMPAGESRGQDVPAAAASASAARAQETSAAAVALQAAGAERAAASYRALLDRYCVACHNERLVTGRGGAPSPLVSQLRAVGLTLDTLNLTALGEHPEAWEKVVRKLRGGMMPPAGRPRPDEAGTLEFVAWLETELDSAAAARPAVSEPAARPRGRSDPHRLDHCRHGSLQPAGGRGAAVALPLLDAMAPALTATARTAARPVRRLGFFYGPNGMFLSNFHPAGNGGRDFAMTPILQPLEPFRDVERRIQRAEENNASTPLHSGLRLRHGRRRPPHPVRPAGGARRRWCGAAVRHGHLKYPLHTPFMNLGLSLLEKVDVEVERIADSTGRLAGV